MSPRDRYGDDVLADPRAHRRVVPSVTVTPGLVVEADGGFVGRAVACSAREVTLRDRRGRERRFSLEPGLFRVDDQPVRLVAPARRPPEPAAPKVSNSGSVAVPDAPARVARASRILVEGVHDAELLEQVWGHDLRVEGVVVDVLHGADDLEAVVREFGPGPRRRLGILLDHLVAGSKESRIAATVRHPQVLVTGHPFVDVWQAVRPEVVGIDAWPQVPRGEPWKEGVARRLGHDDHRELWRRIRTSVTTWRDLDQSLIRAVEELIDFVTVPTD
ncbi:DUF3097 family protein [Egicoccus halophilus]|uniref:DUF3097 domain-containing protein n=1 Tax=Egicoccus halophilus TaxID=1670830 RepID=A0A8J3A6G2_9ACTN|nr:DUF3097 family protein [Egicoccus halophilus]GGI04617.1 hypothetical protein GCM10011354_09990 [Egicoccus halophilus]